MGISWCGDFENTWPGRRKPILFLKAFITEKTNTKEKLYDEPRIVNVTSFSYFTVTFKSNLTYFFLHKTVQFVLKAKNAFNVTTLSLF